MRIILASGSPRRTELLPRLVDSFDVIPSDVVEPTEGAPEDRVLSGARLKAHDVASRHRGMVIGADTLVAIGDRVLGKPSSREEAREMLRELSGREHRVLTGLCVLSGWSGEELTSLEETVVRFRLLGEGEIDAYLATGEGDDKAGAYAIQSRAALFVEGIRGDFYNVMGLPLCRLGLMLREMGVRV